MELYRPIYINYGCADHADCSKFFPYQHAQLIRLLTHSGFKQAKEIFELFCAGKFISKLLLLRVVLFL